LANFSLSSATLFAKFPIREADRVFAVSFVITFSTFTRSYYHQKLKMQTQRLTWLSCKCKHDDLTLSYVTLLDATRRYSTLLDSVRRYLTILDATRRYSTLLDAIRYLTLLDATQRCSTLLDITRRYSTLLDAF
jgi:hypothetical protein